MADSFAHNEGAFEPGGLAMSRNGADLGAATVIGTDSNRDLALLRTTVPVDGHVFKLAPRAPRLGEDVAALGFPLGLPLTVTRGTASGSARSVYIDGATRQGLIQTDAAVNHGNSGGPLLSTKTGEVLGLVDLKETDASGIGFAVSAPQAQTLLDAWRVSPHPVAAPTCAAPKAPEQSAATPTTAAPPTTTTAPATTTPTENDAVAPENTLYAYWSYVRLGQYRSAYEMMSPSDQARVGGLSKWLDYYAGDPVESVNVSLQPATVSGDTAYVSVDTLETVGAATGCHDWTGTYTLTRGSSGWLIDYAKLSRTNC
jgi:hypothetical protein